MLLIICREKSFVKEIGDIGFRENWCEKREKKKRRVSESDYVTQLQEVDARKVCRYAPSSLCTPLIISVSLIDRANG